MQFEKNIVLHTLVSFSKTKLHSSFGLVQFWKTHSCMFFPNPTNQLGAFGDQLSPLVNQLGPMSNLTIKQASLSHDCILSLQILREIWKISNLVSKWTYLEFETLLIDSLN